MLKLIFFKTNWVIWNQGFHQLLNFLSLDFQGVNFGSLERKTWMSGTSKGDTMYMCMEIIALINLLRGKIAPLLPPHLPPPKKNDRPAPSLVNAVH